MDRSRQAGDRWEWMKEPQRTAAVERERDKILKVIRGPGRFVREEEERKAVERRAKKREREETKARAAEEAVKEEEKKAAREKQQERQKEAKKGEADSKPHPPTLVFGAASRRLSSAETSVRLTM